MTDLIDPRGVALLLGALLAVAFLRRMVLREAVGGPGVFSPTMAKTPVRHPSNRLSELGRLLDLATISASDAHRVLRPLVADIAGTWLHGAHGIDLTDPRARDLLPSEVWTFASPTSRRPADPHGPGLTPAAIDSLITRLESLR